VSVEIGLGAVTREAGASHWRHVVDKADESADGMENGHNSEPCEFLVGTFCCFPTFCRLPQGKMDSKRNRLVNMGD
jgi:hypothetical protein